MSVEFGKILTAQAAIELTLAIEGDEAIQEDYKLLIDLQSIDTINLPPNQIVNIVKILETFGKKRRAAAFVTGHKKEIKSLSEIYADLVEDVGFRRHRFFDTAEEAKEWLFPADKAEATSIERR